MAKHSRPRYPEVGARYARARNRLGITQEYVAERSGVSIGTLRNLESGIPVSKDFHDCIVTVLGQERVKRGVPIDDDFLLSFPREFADKKAHQNSVQTTTTAASSNQPANAHLSALKAALKHLKSHDECRQLTVGCVRTQAELFELYDIGDAAYGEASISFDLFEQLWRAQPKGLVALFCDERIIGGIGIWPVTKEWAEKMKNRKLRERELDPASMKKLRAGATSTWYISGVVLMPNVSRRAVKTLLGDGIKLWLSEAGLRFPCEFLALASADEGRRLLEGFEFKQIQHRSRMPDGYPLYQLVVPSLDRLVVEGMRRRDLPVD